jgi:hypothetical protein
MKRGFSNFKFKNEVEIDERFHVTLFYFYHKITQKITLLMYNLLNGW